MNKLNKRNKALKTAISNRTPIINRSSIQTRKPAREFSQLPNDYQCKLYSTGSCKCCQLPTVEYTTQKDLEKVVSTGTIGCVLVSTKNVSFTELRELLNYSWERNICLIIDTQIDIPDDVLYLIGTNCYNTLRIFTQGTSGVCSVPDLACRAKKNGVFTTLTLSNITPSVSKVSDLISTIEAQKTHVSSFVLSFYKGTPYETLDDTVELVKGCKLPIDYLITSDNGEMTASTEYKEYLIDRIKLFSGKVPVYTCGECENCFGFKLSQGKLGDNGLFMYNYEK